MIALLCVSALCKFLSCSYFCEVLAMFFFYVPIIGLILVSTSKFILNLSIVLFMHIHTGSYIIIWKSQGRTMNQICQTILNVCAYNLKCKCDGDKNLLGMNLTKIIIYQMLSKQSITESAMHRVQRFLLYAGIFYCLIVILDLVSPWLNEHFHEKAEYHDAKQYLNNNNKASYKSYIQRMFSLAGVHFKICKILS